MASDASLARRLPAWGLSSKNWRTAGALPQQSKPAVEGCGTIRRTKHVDNLECCWNSAITSRVVARALSASFTNILRGCHPAKCRGSNRPCPTRSSARRHATTAGQSKVQVRCHHGIFRSGKRRKVGTSATIRRARLTKLKETKHAACSLVHDYRNLERRLGRQFAEYEVRVMYVAGQHASVHEKRATPPALTNTAMTASPR